MKAIDHASPALFYRQQGSGAAVIALHGSASTGGQWTSLMSELEADYRVIAPDLPGYGASQDLPSGSRSSLRAAARAVAEIAVALGEPVHLIGHSFGGTIALKIAMVWPELVRSLTLIEPAAFHFLRDGTRNDLAVLAEIQAVAGIMSACAADDEPEIAMAHFVDYWNGEGTWSRLSMEQRARLVPQLGAVLANFAAGFADRTPLADCALVSCPVQMIMALESKAPAQRVTELVAGAVPHARLTMAAEAGHMAPVTHPRIINAIIARHLADTDAAHPTRATPSLPRWVA